MAIQWDFKRDHIGKVIIEQNTPDGKQRFAVDIYRGNCLAIFIYNFEENGQKMYNLHNFFMDKEHAKRMLGIDRRYKETYGHNLLDDGFERMVAFHLDSSKSSKDLAKLLMDAKWKQPLIIKMYPDIADIEKEEDCK